MKKRSTNRPMIVLLRYVESRGADTEVLHAVPLVGSGWDAAKVIEQLSDLASVPTPEFLAWRRDSSDFRPLVYTDGKISLGFPPMELSHKVGAVLKQIKQNKIVALVALGDVGFARVESLADLDLAIEGGVLPTKVWMPKKILDRMDAGAAAQAKRAATSARRRGRVEGGAGVGTLALLALGVYALARR